MLCVILLDLGIESFLERKNLHLHLSDPLMVKQFEFKRTLWMAVFKCRHNKLICNKKFFSNSKVQEITKTYIEPALDHEPNNKLEFLNFQFHLQ